MAITLSSCNKVGGSAPSETYSALTLTPEAIVVPNGVTYKISVLGTIEGTQQKVSIASKAKCVTDNLVARVDANGYLINNYLGSAVLKLNLVCSYEGLEDKAEITIVPAVLTSIGFNKTMLQLGSNQSDVMKAYGYFRDATNAIFSLDITDFVSWRSVNPSVVNVSKGLLKSGVAGLTNITATYGALTASTLVNVSWGTQSATAVEQGVGLLGSYYDFGLANPSSVPWVGGALGDPFEKLSAQRIDSQVNFNWILGTNHLGQTHFFGVRWTGKLYVPLTGSYIFSIKSDDGVRMWLDDLSGPSIIDNWTLHTLTEDSSSSVNLLGGHFYDIKIEYFQNIDSSAIELLWESSNISKQTIPQVYLFPE